MYKRFALILGFVTLSLSCLSQVSTYKMKDTTVTECEGFHTDSDALFGGLYGMNEDFIFKICPGTGALITYSLSLLNLEQGSDTIFFYNGPDTSSTLIAFYTGSPSPTPGPILANSGCLTIRFKSDGTLQLSGWSAYWSSTPPVIPAPNMEVSLIEPPTCDSSSFLIEFDRKLHCDSIVNSTISFSGYNPPTVTSISKVNCSTDSSRFARVHLNSPFIYNCTYIMSLKINILGICDSVYKFTSLDTFDFKTCEIPAQLTYSDSILCFGNCASLLAIAPSSCNSFTYSWNNGLPATAGPHSVCPTSTTTYKVTILESVSGKTFVDSITIIVIDTVEKNIQISTKNTGELPTCNSRFFRVKLNKPIKCNLLDSVNFTLTSPGGNYIVTNVTALNCINNKIDSVRVKLNKALNKNCDYFLKFELNYLDSCEGSVSILAKDTFQITDCPFTISSIYNNIVCSNTCSRLKINTSGCNNYNFLWSNGLPNSPGPFSICPSGDSTFYVQVTEVSTGIIVYDTIKIEVKYPKINPVGPFCSYDSAVILQAKSGGGIWKGNGILDSLTGKFSPSAAGAGSHVIIHNIGSCQDTITILVASSKTGNDTNLCANGIPLSLNNGSPSGGIWSGTNVNSGTSTFTPINYGNYTAFYTVNGCTDSMNIMVDTIAFSYYTDTLCGNSPAFTIPHSPSGGNWTGSGITFSSGIFNPSTASNGSNQVYYSYKGCNDSINFVVIKVNAGPDTNACPTQSPLTLSPATPSGGMWSGIGITNSSSGIFDPGTISGNWMSRITYSSYGCLDSLEIKVVQTSINPDTIYLCSSKDSILISSISGLITNPKNGTWSGNGVKNQNGSYYLYPKLLGMGFHTLFYLKNTCSDSVVLLIYPDSLSYTDTTICDIISPFKLDSTHNMTGAIWQGNGIVDSINGVFDPTVAGIGLHVITYKTNGNICNKTINVTVYTFIPASITIQDSLCYNNQNIAINASPPGGNWSGSGNYNKTTGTINPALAGNGFHQIIYSFGQGVCYTSTEKMVFIRDSISVTVFSATDTICKGKSTSLLGSATGGYPNPNYQFSWSNSTSNSNTITVTPPSNTSYILTVTDGCSDPSLDTINITVLNIKPTLITSNTVCYSDLGFVSYDLSQKSIYTFSWTNPAVLGDTVFGEGNDSVFVSVTNNFGCKIDTFAVIKGADEIIANFTLNPNIFPNCLSSESKKLIVEDKSKGGKTGIWNFGDGNTSPYNSSNNSETHIYSESGSYTISLLIKNDFNCFDTLTKEICVSGQQFFIADVFSPNGDGTNDILYVRSNEANSLEFLIYDRWGKLVFQSSDVNNGWDGTFQGKELESGIYFYSVKLVLTSGEEVFKKGDITLSR